MKIFSLSQNATSTSLQTETRRENATQHKTIEPIVLYLQIPKMDLISWNLYWIIILIFFVKAVQCVLCCVFFFSDTVVLSLCSICHSMSPFWQRWFYVVFLHQSFFEDISWWELEKILPSCEGWCFSPRTLQGGFGLWMCIMSISVHQNESDARDFKVHTLL